MDSDLKSKKVLVSGISGAIGKSLAQKLKDSGAEVITLSSKAEADIITDLCDESSIKVIQEWLKSHEVVPDALICCSGLLHDKNNMPEKNLMQLNKFWLNKSLEMNVVSHIHLAQALDGLIGKDKKFTWISLSAMVGSISDNYLGGWYSYRMTKSALNMFIKGLSLEWKRKNKQNKVFSVHPGTTRSNMSEPFNVRKDKLYEPDLSAERILKILEDAENFETGSFINWSGQIIPW